MPVDHRAMTEQRLEKSLRIVERQRELIAARRAAGESTTHSEQVLATFERSHAAFKRSLVWLMKEQARAKTDGHATGQQQRAVGQGRSAD
jgi:hypothetical protein